MARPVINDPTPKYPEGDGVESREKTGADFMPCLTIGVMVLIQFYILDQIGRMPRYNGHSCESLLGLLEG